MKLSVMGAGYVGMITGICLAKLGNEVTLIDIDDEKLNQISRRKSPIYEEGLDDILTSVSLGLSSDIKKTIDSELIFVCVGTPNSKGESILLDQVEKSIWEISQALP